MTDADDPETVPVTLFPTERQLPTDGGGPVIRATVTDVDETGDDDEDPVETFCRDWQAYLSEWPESLSNI